MFAKRNKGKLWKMFSKEWGRIKQGHFNYNLIKAYLDHIPKTNYFLSEKTKQDLDFEAFFEQVDRTTSAIGQQYLYSQLSNINYDLDRKNLQEDQVKYYENNEADRIEAQCILHELSSTDDYYFPYMIFGKLPATVSQIWIIKTLQLFSIFGTMLAIFFPVIIIPLIFVFAANLGIHYWHKNRIGNFAYIFSRTSKLAKCAQRLLPFYCNQMEDEKISSAIKTLDKITSKIFILKSESMADMDLSGAFWYAIELIKIITLAEVTTFHAVVNDIVKSRKEIQDLFEYIGKTDVAISISSLRTSLPYYCIPQIATNSKKELSVKGLFHPLVEDCISNNIHLNQRSLLLTGSNMSGKSTFIKSINLNAISSQMLNTSFSHDYIAPPFSLATSIRIHDDINESKSYYMEEVRSVGILIELTNQTNIQYLFTIDEVFKGTNTIERISAAKAILEHLNQSNHLVLVSTHDIELTQLLKEGYDLYYFQESIEQQTLSFDYKLKQGALKERNAINILEMSGYPPAIIKEANRIAKKFEQQKLNLDI